MGVTQSAFFRKFDTGYSITRIAFRLEPTIGAGYKPVYTITTCAALPPVGTRHRI